MKLNDIVIGALVVVSLSAVFGWLDERDTRIAMMDKELMCEIKSNKTVHQMPCRILTSYVMAVSL